jgi:hypothetical protein
MSEFFLRAGQQSARQPAQHNQQRSQLSNVTTGAEEDVDSQATAPPPAPPIPPSLPVNRYSSRVAKFLTHNPFTSAGQQSRPQSAHSGRPGDVDRSDKAGEARHSR